MTTQDDPPGIAALADELARWTSPRPARPSIQERYETFIAENRHVLDRALLLARARLDRGETYISVKSLYEELRTSLGTTKDSGYRLNNDFTAPLARQLLELEPRLAGVIELRRRKTR